MLGTIKDTSRGIGRLIRGGNDFSTPSRHSRTRDYAVLGGAAGAVAGATIGTIKGFEAQANNSVKEVRVERDIVEPELTGYSHRTRADRERYCVERKEGSCVDYDTKTRGWWHNYSPNVKERVVGTFEEPQFKNSTALGPISGALLGGLAGGLVGVAAGLGVSVLVNSMTKDSKSPIATSTQLTAPPQEAFDKGKRPSDKTKDSALETRMGAYAIGGTAIGAGVGIYLGIQAGAAEAAGNQVNTRSWQVPVTADRTIGHIPEGYYEPNSFWQIGPSNGRGRAETVPVNRQVPVYNEDGSIKLQTAQKTFESQRYGRVAGALAGGVIGAGVGLAAGVSLGLADKLLTEAIAKN